MKAYRNYLLFAVLAAVAAGGLTYVAQAGPDTGAIPKPKPPQNPRPTECPSPIHPNHYACCAVHPNLPVCQ